MKSSRRRSSGTRQAFASQLSMATRSAPRAGLGSSAASRPPRARSRPRRPASSTASSAVGFALRASSGFFGTGSPRSQVTLPPAASIFSFAVFEKPCAETESAFDSSPTPSTLTSTETLRISRLRLERLRRHLVARLEALLEVAEVDRLAVGAERADRHRVRGRVAAQLREPHVDRHLAALEAGRHLVRPGAGLLALEAAARVAALARAEAAADRACAPCVAGPASANGG